MNLCTAYISHGHEGGEKWQPASVPHPSLSPLLRSRGFKNMKKEKETQGCW